MPFVQRVVEPKYLSRTSLWDEDGRPLVSDDELEAVTNNTLSNALRQLASLVLVADDIFLELGDQLKEINKRSEGLRAKIEAVEGRVAAYDPKKVTVRKCFCTAVSGRASTARVALKYLQVYAEAGGAWGGGARAPRLAGFLRVNKDYRVCFDELRVCEWYFRSVVL